MSLTFNCGIGGVLVVDKSVTETVLQQIVTSGLTASVIGRLCEKQGNVMETCTQSQFFIKIYQLSTTEE